MANIITGLSISIPVRIFTGKFFKKYAQRSILQYSILRPPMIIRPFNVVSVFALSILLTFILRPPTIYQVYFAGHMHGLKMEGPLYTWKIFKAFSLVL